MHIFKIILCVFIFQLTLWAQAPDTIWTRVFGGDISQDWGFSFVATGDSGFVILGATQKDNSLEDLWIFKIDKNGHLLWSKTYGNPQSYYEIGRCIIKTKDDNFIVCGFCTRDHNDFNWLLKFNSEGDTLWTRTCGISGLSAGAWSVKEVENNNLVVLGITTSFPEDLGLSLNKVDSSGQTLWSKFYPNAASFVALPTFIVTKDNNYVLLSNVNGPSDVLLLKTDSEGDTIWTRTFGGAGWQYGYSIVEAPDGGYIITGSADPPVSQNYQDLWIFKVGPNGDLIWSRTYGESAGSEIGYGIIRVPPDGYLIAGSRGIFDSDIWIMRINSVGDTLWTKTVGGQNTDESYAALKTFDDGYLILGWSSSFGFSNSWLIKLAQEPSFVQGSQEIISTEYSIFQNYPNPFNPSTTIEYSVPHLTQVQVKVFDVLGNEIETLVNEEKPSGTYRVNWNAANLAGAIYFYQLRTGDFIQTKKMILLK